jgi:hypothetical protein
MTAGGPRGKGRLNQFTIDTYSGWSSIKSWCTQDDVRPGALVIVSALDMSRFGVTEVDDPARGKMLKYYPETSLNCPSDGHRLFVGIALAELFIKMADVPVELEVHRFVLASFSIGQWYVHRRECVIVDGLNAKGWEISTIND